MRLRTCRFNQIEFLDTTSGTMDLRPGGQDSIGKLAGRVPKIGDFQLYVCRSGDLPFDDTGKVVSKPRTSFQCKPKSQ